MNTGKPSSYKSIENAVKILTHIIGRSWLETNAGEEANLLHSAYRNIKLAHEAVSMARRITTDGRQLHAVLCNCAELSTAKGKANSRDAINKKEIESD